MVIAALSLTVQGPKRARIVQSLRALSGPTRVEQGCLGCRILEEADDRGRLLYLELWESGEYLVARLRSRRYRHVLALMEESEVSPELQFLWVSAVKGLEFLETARLEPSAAQSLSLEPNHEADAGEGPENKGRREPLS